MYKRASRNLQRAHRVSAPLPTGGMIGLGGYDAELIPSASNMGIEECRDELRQLGVELARAENELAILKRTGASTTQMGHRIQGVVQRRGVIKTRLQSLLAKEREGDPSETLAAAIREVAPADVQRAIFKRARQMHKTGQ
jgi:hypothetical protein